MYKTLNLKNSQHYQRFSSTISPFAFKISLMGIVERFSFVRLFKYSFSASCNRLSGVRFLRFQLRKLFHT